MTLYINRNLPPSNPQTHVLLIAVNNYPHLNGGSGPAAPKTYGQGQLTTPVHSALRISNWFETRLNNPSAPLGTIEMVLSPGTTPAPHVDAATLPNIKSAFSGWLTRGAQNSNNVAWFYFCGHGLETNVTALLAEDYGADPNNPWDGAFDFRAMLTNLADWTCRTQIFVLDACRNSITDQLSGLSALKSATPTSFPPRDAPVFKATSLGNAALGPANAPSYFSAALVDCLEHLGASHYDGSQWIVDTSSLGRALVERMNRTIDGGVRKFLPIDIGGGTQNLAPTQIHTLAPADVHIMSMIACDPAAADDEATLEANEPSLRYKVDSRGMVRPWCPNLPLGDYDLSGKFVAGSTYSSITSRLGDRALPPIFVRNLKAV